MNNNKLLSILITNYNTADFVGLLLYSLKKLTKNDHLVVINDNGSSRKEILKLLDSAKKYDNVYLHFRKSKGETASLAHGKALDILMKEVNTKYTAVFDSDAVVLKKNWDELLINRLGDKVKIVGTPLGKDWSGNKPYDFPFQFVVLFKTEIFKKLNISWQPKDTMCNPAQDTGWELKLKYTKAGYRGDILIAKNTRFYKKGPFKNIICAEYYLKGDSQVFASHFGRGSTMGACKYMRNGKKYFYKIPLVGRYFLKQKGKEEKNKWINKCYDIILKEN